MSFIESHPWGNIIREKTNGNGSLDSVGAGGGSARLNLEKIMNPERYMLNIIRGTKETDDPTTNNDYKQIATWMSYDEVRAQLRTTIPKITKIEDLPMVLREVDRAFHNKNKIDLKTNQYVDDDPNKIIPIVAVNGLDEPVASLTIRLKGEPDAETTEEIKEEGKIQNGNDQGKVKNNRIAGIENLVVDPKLHGAHFGTQLMTAALDFVFSSKLYDGKPALAVRLWIRCDAGAGEKIGKKMDFFRSFGFEVIKGNWKGYAKKRGIPNPDNWDGQRYELTKAEWERVKREDAERTKEEQKLILPQGILDLATLRIPRASAESN